MDEAVYESHIKANRKELTNSINLINFTIKAHKRHNFIISFVMNFDKYKLT